MLPRAQGKWTLLRQENKYNKKTEGQERSENGTNREEDHAVPSSSEPSNEQYAQYDYNPTIRCDVCNMVLTHKGRISRHLIGIRHLINLGKQMMAPCFKVWKQAPRDGTRAEQAGELQVDQAQAATNANMQAARRAA